MGKLIYFILILVFVDMMFFVFVNTDAVSINSVVFKSIGELSSTGDFNLIKNLLSTQLLINILLSLAVAIAAAGVILKFTGGSYNATDFVWASVASTYFIQLGYDFVHIYKVLAEIQPPLTSYLALFLIAPFAIIFVFIAIEWIRGKD